MSVKFLRWHATALANNLVLWITIRLLHGTELQPLWQKGDCDGGSTL